MIYMSSWLEQLARVKSGIWEFFRGVWSSNRDLPFHDYEIMDLWDGTEQT